MSLSDDDWEVMQLGEENKTLRCAKTLCKNNKQEMSHF